VPGISAFWEIGLGTPQPTLLIKAQCEQYTRFPALDESLLALHYLLSEDDLRLVCERQRDFNRLGYTVQLTVLRHLGRTLRLGVKGCPFKGRIRHCASEARPAQTFSLA